jgi:2'-5' RNA ligase
MPLVVFSCPIMNEREFNWIQTVRLNYDSQYQLIAPHFTLVFPCQIPNQAEFIEHIQRKTHGLKQIRFTIRDMLTVKDSMSENYHLFLVPEEGSKDIINLHDTLYTGLLAAELRHDIPFVPHITIGNGRGSGIFQNEVDRWKIQPKIIQGRLEILEIAILERGNLLSVERIRLDS